MLDYPSDRKIHKKPMPLSGGGILFIVTFVFVKILIKDLFIDSIILFGTFMFIVGLVDDFINIKPLAKLFLQLIIVVLFLINIDKVYLIHFFSNYAFNLIVTIVWMIFVINAINLIDGIDGLAAGLSFIIFTSVSSIAIQNNYSSMISFTLIFASSLVIFLRFNIPPAKVFLGDSGSLFLGFVISGISLYISSKTLVSYSFFIPVMFLLIPLFDVVRVTFSRVQKGKNIFQADKEHIHHKLLDYGFSDRQVLLFLYFISCLISIVTLKAYNKNLEIIGIGIIISFYIMLVIIKIFQLFNFRRLVRTYNLKLRWFAKKLIKGSSIAMEKSKSLFWINLFIISIIFIFYLKFIKIEVWTIQKSIIFIIAAVILISNQVLLNIDDTVKIFSNFSIFWIYFYITYILNFLGSDFLNIIISILILLNGYKIFIKKQFDLFLYNPFEILIIHTIIILLFSIKGIDIPLLLKTFIIYYSTKSFFSKESKEYKIFVPFTTIMILIGPFYYLLISLKKGF